MHGSIEFSSIDGPLTKRPVRFGLYLPAAYHMERRQTFPVLYFLHGLNENYRTNLKLVAAALEQAMDREVVRPMLVVTPDGYVNSMWADSKSGHKPAETNFIRELIPHIEKNYRCGGLRAHRIVGGFSMGGYGACRYAVKFPDLFNTCFSMDGALHTLSTFKRIRGPVFEEIFENDAAYFRQYCIYEWAQNNLAVLGDHFFYMLVGQLKSFTDRFRRLFGELGLCLDDAHFRLTGCGHDAACILNRAGLELFERLEKRMQ